jgi:hypothetical protein
MFFLSRDAARRIQTDVTSKGSSSHRVVRAVVQVPKEAHRQAPAAVVPQHQQRAPTTAASRAIHAHAGTVAENTATTSSRRPPSRVNEMARGDIAARIRKARNAIEKLINEFEAFETGLLQDIQAAKQQADEKLRFSRNRNAAIRSVKRARRLQRQVQGISRHLERLEKQLDTVSCAEQLLSTTRSLSRPSPGGTTQEHVNHQLDRLLVEIQNNKIDDYDFNRQINDIIDASQLDGGGDIIDDETYLRAIHDEQLFASLLFQPTEFGHHYPAMISPVILTPQLTDCIDIPVAVLVDTVWNSDSTLSI